MSDLDKLLEQRRANSHYYLRFGDGPENEVTEAEFIAAERAAGFFPKTGCGPLATAGFGSNHVLGRIESPAFKDYPRLADLERVVIERAMTWGETGGAGGAASLEQPLLMAVDALLREREGRSLEVLAHVPRLCAECKIVHSHADGCPIQVFTPSGWEGKSK